MRILAFDTATRATAVALAGTGERVLEARDDPPPGERPRHASRLLPLTAELLERAGIGFEDIDRLAVGVGPGTFTGLRIGVATARALGRVTGGRPPRFRRGGTRCSPARGVRGGLASAGSGRARDQPDGAEGVCS